MAAGLVSQDEVRMGIVPFQPNTFEDAGFWVAMAQAA